MLQVTISINDTKKQEVIDAFSAEFDYDNHKLENETKGQFTLRVAKGHFKEVIKNIVRSQRSSTQEKIIDEDIKTNLDGAIT